jgi:predicted small secreted protein
MKKIFAILLLVGLTGCNTISGIGQDVQKGGEKVQELAKDVQRKI